MLNLSTLFFINVSGNETCFTYTQVRAAISSAVVISGSTQVENTNSSHLSSKWSVLNSAFFAITVITTIGIPFDKLVSLRVPRTIKTLNIISTSECQIPRCRSPKTFGEAVVRLDFSHNLHSCGWVWLAGPTRRHLSALVLSCVAPRDFLPPTYTSLPTSKFCIDFRMSFEGYNPNLKKNPCRFKIWVCLCGYAAMSLNGGVHTMLSYCVSASLHFCF